VSKRFEISHVTQFRVFHDYVLCSAVPRSA
jgi:hypothetical protein